MSSRIVCAFAMAAATLQTASATKGVVTLDDLTFDKIVTGSVPVLVKFDKQYAYGDSEDAFKETAEKVGELKTNLIVAEVGTQDYGDTPENKATHDRFKVSKDDWPVYKYFPAGGGEPITGPKLEGSKDDMKATLGSFLKINAGLSVFIGKGQIPAFDDLAEKYVGGDLAALDAAKALLGDKEVCTDEDDTKTGEYYIKTMERCQSKGADYPATELARLKGIVNTKISDKKKEMFSSRINILSSFITK